MTLRSRITLTHIVNLVMLQDTIRSVACPGQMVHVITEAIHFCFICTFVPLCPIPKPECCRDVNVSQRKRLKPKRINENLLPIGNRRQYASLPLAAGVVHRRVCSPVKLQDRQWRACWGAAIVWAISIGVECPRGWCESSKPPADGAACDRSNKSAAVGYANE